jgi:hypothetical protein
VDATGAGRFLKVEIHKSHPGESLIVSAFEKIPAVRMEATIGFANIAAAK